MVCGRELSAALVALASLAACAVEAPRPRFGAEHRVLVVANARDRASLRLARRYIEARQVAATHSLELDTDPMEEIDRATYEREILAPLTSWWRACPDSALPSYLLLVRGLPLKIRGTGGRDGDQSAIDSELALLPKAARGESVELRGRRPNPYYQPTLAGPYAPFRPGGFDLVLPCRLDAFTEAECESLIARGGRARAAPWVVLLDARTDGASEPGDQWLRAAARELRALRVTVRFDSTADFLSRADHLLGYASWGSNDPAYRRGSRFDWLPGGLAVTFVSTSARTFREPPASWTPGRAEESAHRFGGSSQSLIGDLIRSGATGVSGAVYEPYLDGCVRPEFVFAAYLTGRTLGESFYLAMPFVSWMAVMVGDPLTAPFAPPIGGD